MQSTALISSPDAETPSRRVSTISLVAAIKVAQTRAPGLTLTQLVIFLTVAANEGIRLNDLGDRINESQATVSRSVSALTAAGLRGSSRPGYDLLVLLRDRDDGRGRRAALSEAGRRLLTWIETTVQGRWGAA
jgi:DNA-binding MarR family transcriptional regulator